MPGCSPPARGACPRCWGAGRTSFCGIPPLPRADAPSLANAVCIDATTLVSFFASTVEIAYIVVKNANRRVMKSA